jgi:YHS domain-containing protein
MSVRSEHPNQFIYEKISSSIPSYDSGSYSAGEYPLKTCVVSGEKLGEMGDAFVFVYQGTEVRLCCEMCKPKFDKNPAKYLEKLQPPSGSSK